MAAKQGDNVKVHYTGKLQDGQVFDSSVNKDPLGFQLGAGQLIPGFEKAVMGMNVGDKATIEIPSAEAYGAHNDEMLIEVSKQQMPAGLEPEVGMTLQVQQPDGQPTNVVIYEVREQSIVLDANHPLAGKDLIFDIEVVAIN